MNTPSQPEEIGCICSSYDARGRSVCGVPCPEHPLDKGCTSCGIPIHGERMCWPCQAKWLNENRPPTIKALNDAYSGAIKAFQGLESYLNHIENPVFIKRDERNRPHPEIPVEDVRAAALLLRKLWQSSFIPWQISEAERLNWYED